jgi:hypothetical protein
METETVLTGEAVGGGGDGGKVGKWTRRSRWLSQEPQMRG